VRMSFKDLILSCKPLFLVWLIASASLFAYAEPENLQQTPTIPKEISSTNNTPSNSQEPKPALESHSDSLHEVDGKLGEIPNTNIVMTIIWLTGIGLSLCFILATYFARDHSKQLEPYLGEGLLLQTIVVIMIVQCVLALAIAKILNATEIGTIYGGIIGYIFGRRETTKNKPDNGQQ
jgi:hypothetical protein